jgi:cytochrome b subunit of formate dehydrogenase
MQRTFRKNHRFLALIVTLPLILTVLSGLAFTIVGEWFGNDELADAILKVHTMEIIGLEKIYPLLIALGLIGMIVTGITMTSLFRNRPPSPKSAGDR